MTYGPEDRGPCCRKILTRSQVRALSKLSGWSRPWTRGPPKFRPKPWELKLVDGALLLPNMSGGLTRTRQGRGEAETIA